MPTLALNETGVKAHRHFHKANRKWIARIDKDYLGTFLSKEAAAKAYDEAAKVRRGEFAVLNLERDLCQ